MHTISLALIAIGFAAAAAWASFVFARRFLQLERNVALLAANMAKPNSATDEITKRIADDAYTFDVRDALRNEIYCRGEKSDHVSHDELMQGMKEYEKKKAECARMRDDEYTDSTWYPSVSNSNKRYMPELMVKEAGKLKAMPKPASASKLASASTRAPSSLESRYAIGVYA